MATRDCSVKTEAAKEEAIKTRRYSVDYPQTPTPTDH
ncbi:Uncharacterised protein [Providencia alcalifaciens]|nr:Uncharacterised protein [Providencia alcalifaciens]